MDDHLVVQFPALEPIVRDLRFDQIHHQHFHYFSWKSLLTVLDDAQLEVVSSGLDWNHYGAGNLVLRKKQLHSSDEIRLLPWGQSALAEYVFLTNDRLLQAISTYRTYQLVVNEVLSAGPYVALGAGLMSPIVFYHLVETWANCKAIYDGEVSKYGTQYFGTPRPVSPIPDSLEGEVVLISGSVSKFAGRALGKIAMTKGAESLVYPVLNF
jgi:cyclopropane-fatty-acyl-phospholipid synthase